jgi:hypothetical protein
VLQKQELAAGLQHAASSATAAAGSSTEHRRNVHTTTVSNRSSTNGQSRRVGGHRLEVQTALLPPLLGARVEQAVERGSAAKMTPSVAPADGRGRARRR